MNSLSTNRPTNDQPLKLSAVVNYGLTIVGLLLLVVLGIRAASLLTDSAYVSGKPRVQSPLAAHVSTSSQVPLRSAGQTSVPLLANTTSPSETGSPKKVEAQQVGSEKRMDKIENVRNVSETVRQNITQQAHKSQKL